MRMHVDLPQLDPAAHPYERPTAEEIADVQAFPLSDYKIGLKAFLAGEDDRLLVQVISGHDEWGEVFHVDLSRLVRESIKDGFDPVMLKRALELVIERAAFDQTVERVEA